MHHNLDRPWVHISMGNLLRELDGKVLLASVLLKRGFNVSLGSIGKMPETMATLPRGIYIDGRFSAARHRYISHFIQLGFKVTAFDEEATSFPDAEYYGKYLVSAETLGLCKAAFCWGTHHADAVRGVIPASLHHAVQATGHPRFDLLREPGRTFYAADVAAIRKRYGKFVLVNSNAGGWRLEGRVEERWSQLCERYKMERTPAAYRKFLGQYEHGLKRHHDLLNLAMKIAGVFPEHTVVIRPHPSERLEEWRRWLPEGIGNIAVIREGSAVPWMKAAALTLHSSCTTGTEAFLAEAPVVSYLTDSLRGFDAELPNALSIRARSESEALELVRQALDGKLPPSQKERISKEALAETHYAARRGPLASERISEILEKIAYTDTLSPTRLNDLVKDSKRTILLEPSRQIHQLVGDENQTSQNRRETKRLYREVTSRLNNTFAAVPCLAQPLVLTKTAAGTYLLTAATGESPSSRVARFRANLITSLVRRVRTRKPRQMAD